MTKEAHKRTLYLICDYVTALVSWMLFFLFRKWNNEGDASLEINNIVADANFWYGLIFIPLGWLLLYAIFGTYRRVLRKARLKEIGETITTTVIGVIILFFLVMLDDIVRGSKNYYIDLLFLFSVHFTLTYLPRLIITSHIVSQVHTRRLGFPTVLVGGGIEAYNTLLELEKQEIYSGNLFIGFVTDNDEAIDKRLASLLPHCGTIDNLRNTIIDKGIEEVIVAIGKPTHQRIGTILRMLNGCPDIIIKLTPNCRDFVVGSIKIDNIFHSPLVVIDNRLMPEWEYSVKRIFDIVVSIIVIIGLSPIYLITAIIVKCTSPGPVFYAQERIGYGGKPFKMHKFRSMYVGAEANGPALACDDDPRITPFGRIMRKIRLDEIPQFYNVLKGTMSLVGPRPERQYYIDQIVQRAPEYQLLQRIRPGITSWGQVKYGYASNVDEMIERLRYDLFYIDNMSLTIDIKILLYTVIIIFEGRGK